MSGLKDFRQKEFPEQIADLSALMLEGGEDQVESLFELLETPLGDEAVDKLVANTLHTVLLRTPHAVVKGLDSPSPAVRNFCVNAAGESGAPETADKILAMLPAAVAGEQDAADLHALFTAMSRIDAPQFRQVFREHLNSDDDIIASLCIEAFGRSGDAESVDTLRAHIADAEADERYEVCAVTTWRAIDALAEIGTPEAVQVLVDHIHHRNPTARRLVHEALSRTGEPAVDPLSAAFDSPDVDTRIMAANILGFIGSRRASDALVRAIDDGAVTHPNIAFAVYEGLGRARSMKGLVCLMDAAYTETDESILMAVATALDEQASPGVGAKVAALIKEGDDRSERFVRAVVSSRSDRLFASMHSDADAADRCMDRMLSSRDPEILRTFAESLETLDSERAAYDRQELLNALHEGPEDSGGSRLLAVDDSGAMRNFYMTAGAELGYSVTTAEDGNNALSVIDSSLTFDAIIVDMNMPGMDGIELTGRIREMEAYRNVPILMATTESGKSQAGLAKKAGVSAFLQKPFTAETLKARVSLLLES